MPWRVWQPWMPYPFRPMKSTPVLYSPAMVLAHLRQDNPKTQTRRLIKPQTPSSSGLTHYKGCLIFEHDIESIEKFCPYGGPGDEIWAKETFRCDLHSDFDLHAKDQIWAAGHYLADGAEFHRLLSKAESAKFIHWRNKEGTTPSIFMFRSLSRIQRTITTVRAQRLQDITEEDALAEGIIARNCGGGQTCFEYSPTEDATDTATQAYRSLWNSLHAKPQAVFKKDASGKSILSHYVCHPWELEDLQSYRKGSLLKQLHAAPSFGYELTEENGTYILTNTITGIAAHIHTNPWVWALTYR